MKNKIGLALLLLLLVFPLSSMAAAAKAPVTITVWSYSASPAVADWVKGYMAKFNAANPDIHLDFQLMAYDQISTTILVAAAAGTGPDIAYYAANLIPDRISQGLTLPLNRYLDSWSAKKDFVPDLFNAVTDAKGQIHALPYAMWGIFDLYNTDMLAASGVAIPRDWDSLMQGVRKMTTRNSDGTVKTYGYAAGQTTTLAMYNLELAMEQLGKGMLGIGDTKVDLNNDRGTKAINYLHDLWQTGMPDNSTDASKLSNSIDGKVAIQGYATYNLLDIDAKYAQSLEPKRVVGPTPGTDMIRFNAGTMYILSTSKHPDEAWRVLSDFVSPENSESYIKAQVSYLPVRKTVLNKMNTIITHPLAIKMANLMYSPMTTYGAIHRFWAAIYPKAGDLVLQALQGKRAVTGTLEEAERLMNTTLAEKLNTK